MTNHASQDYEDTRNTLYRMREEALDALEIAKEILRESEHPRAVETYSGLLNNVVKLNAQILELSKTHKDITDRKGYSDPGVDALPAPDKDPKEVNIFVGSTADLQRMMKEARQAEEIELASEDDQS